MNNHLTVEETVENPVEEIPLGETVLKIMGLIKINPSITREELANQIQISVKGIDYHLTKMQKSSILERKGSRKSGIWVLYPGKKDID